MKTVTGNEEMLVVAMLTAFLRDNGGEVREILADEGRDRPTLFANGFGAGVLMVMHALEEGRLQYVSEAEVGKWEKN